MRAISSFNRDAGMSTFWCRAWSAFRTLVSISATGSVNLIVCFSLSHPFAPPIAENLQRLVPPNLLLPKPHPRLSSRAGRFLSRERPYPTSDFVLLNDAPFASQRTWERRANNLAYLARL